jgi:hypothetical protein
MPQSLSAAYIHLVFSTKSVARSSETRVFAILCICIWEEFLNDSNARQSLPVESKTMCTSSPASAERPHKLSG